MQEHAHFKLSLKLRKFFFSTIVLFPAEKQTPFQSLRSPLPNNKDIKSPMRTDKDTNKNTESKEMIAYHHELASTTTCMRRVRSVTAKTQCLESNKLPKGQQTGRHTQPSPRFILPQICGRTENRMHVSLSACLDVRCHTQFIVYHT